jgi:hypothetical protein
VAGSDWHAGAYQTDPVRVPRPHPTLKQRLAVAKKALLSGRDAAPVRVSQSGFKHLSACDEQWVARVGQLSYLVVLGRPPR